MSAEKQKTILLVEDEAIIAMSSKLTLEKFGYRVLTTHSGEEAVAAVAANPAIDLILMDINLGAGMDGTEVAALILKERDLPVVFLSSHTEPEVVEKTEKITSYGYVVKNSSATVLDASIKMAFKLFAAKVREKEKEAALAHSHELMKYVLEHMRSAVAIHDRDLKYIYVSQRYLDDYKVKEKDVIGRHHYDVFPDLPQKWRDIHQRALAGEISRAEDDPYQRADGSLEWTRWECRPWYEADGSIGGIIVYTEVTTERKLAGDALRKSEERMRAIVEGTPHLFFYTQDAEANTTYVSPTIERITGYKPDAWLKRKDWFITDAAINQEAKARTQAHLRGESADEPAWLEIRHALGHEILLEIYEYPITQDGRITGLQGVAHDITERKQAEFQNKATLEALRESEERYRSIINTSPDGISITDMNGRIIMVSPALLAMIGCERKEEMLGRLFTDFVFPEDLNRASSDVSLMPQNSKMGLSEYHGLRPDGSAIDLEVNGDLVWNADGRPIQMVFIIRDISKRKRAESQKEAALVALRESEARAQALLRTIPDMLFRVDRRGIFLDYKADSKDLYVQSEPTLIGKRLRDIVPAGFADLIDLKTRTTLETGTLQTFEYRLPIPGRGVHDYEARMMASGADEVTAIIRDITERNQAEAALQKSETQLKAMLDNSPVVILMIQEGKLIYVNPATEKITGWQEEEFIGKGFTSFVHKDDTELVEKNNRERMGENSFLAPYVLRIIKKTGGYIYTEVNGTVIDLDGKPTMLGFLTDISERKRAEEALRASEAKQSNALQMTHAGHWEYDVDRDLFTFNDNFYRIFRTTAAAVGGYQMSSGEYARRFCHPDDMALVGSETRAAIESNDPNYSRQIEHRIRYADGEAGHIAVRFFIVKDAQDRTIKTYGVNQDISDRIQAQQEIQRQLAEKEILLKEVHHRIKNNIASIGGLISMQMQSLSNPEALAVLQDAVGRVDSMRILYDKLLLSEDYKDISVKNYIESLAGTVVVLFPGRAKVTLEKRIADFPLEPKRLFPLGIIINELLTNIMKYAFAGRKSGSIRLSLAKADNLVTLDIRDNGVGLPDGFDMEKSKGFGLMLVKMLSQQLGGSFSLKKVNGTQSTLEFTI